MLKVSNVRTPVGVSDDEIGSYIAKALRVPSDSVRGYRVLRKALDVRDKSRLEHVFTAAVEIEDESRILRRRSSAVAPYVPNEFRWPEHGDAPLRHRPV